MPEISHLIIIILLSCVSAVLMLACSYKMLQIYQLSSYRTKEVFSWLKATKFEYLARYFALSFFIFVPVSLFIACFGGIEYVAYIGFLFPLVLCILFYRITIRQTKVKLRLTPRIKRLIVLLLALYLLLSFGFFMLTFYTYLQYAYIGILAFLIPFVTAVSNTILLPIENSINNGYKKKATKKLEDMPNLIKIGITGSYGKTTAKNILAKLLAPNYKVCASPKSYNTPMGLALVINNDLDLDTRVLIAEMGARYKGDIAEICDFIKPSIGVLTAIGGMHLETFGDKETLISTKYELIDSLPADGLAVFCGDNPVLCDLYSHTQKNKLLSQSEDSKVVCRYSNVLLSNSGTSFDLELAGEKRTIRTKLLGKHIASIFALCALVAHSLGLKLEQIMSAAAEIEPIEHRLQLIRSGSNTIIDDAYNSNPDGARNAIEILGSMTGTKIVVTPGMVELGDESKQAHFELGEQIARTADYAILIGRNAVEISKGIAGKMEGRLFFAKTLEEATDRIGDIDVANKVILFENDLPDNY